MTERQHPAGASRSGHPSLACRSWAIFDIAGSDPAAARKPRSGRSPVASVAGVYTVAVEAARARSYPCDLIV